MPEDNGDKKVGAKPVLILNGVLIVIMMFVIYNVEITSMATIFEIFLGYVICSVILTFALGWYILNKT